jgi:HPt (histidine-containing phosphotransfer) domain-containing protein
LLLLDLKAFGSASEDVVRRLRQREDSAPVKTAIAALRGEDEERSDEQLLALGIGVVLKKPVAEKGIADLVENWAVVREESVTTVEQSGPPVLDPEVMATFRQLTEGSDVDFISNMIEPALEDVSKRLTQIDDGISAMIYQDIFHEAHTIKGSCGYVGAMRLSAAAAKLEKIAKDESGEQDEMLALLEEMRIELDMVVKKIAREGEFLGRR